MTGVRVVIGGISGLRRAAMVSLLEDAGFPVVAQAGDGGELLRKVRAHRPDVAIVELPEPNRRPEDCVRALRAIRSELPGVGVLLISRRVEAGHAAALLHCGAEGAGYLLEERVTDVARFIGAVREVADHGSVLDPEVVTLLLARTRPGSRIDELSGRDREVLAQMAAGVTNRGIARRMFLSERAIERHVSAIFNALGLDRCRTTHRRVLAVLAHLRAA